MIKIVLSALLIVSFISLARCQLSPCVSAGDCEQQAFAFAFTDDASVDDVQVSDAIQIQADVRHCFAPCVQSARKLAKLSLATGDNLFDVGRGNGKGRGRGRLTQPTFGKANAPGQQNRPNSAANGAAVSSNVNVGVGNQGKNGNRGNSAAARASLLERFNSGLGRGGVGRGGAGNRAKRQSNQDPAVCVAKAIGMSPKKFLDQCRLEKGAAKNPDVEQLLQVAKARRPLVTKAPGLNFLETIRNSVGQSTSGNGSPFGDLGGLFSRFGGIGGRGKRATVGKFKPGKDKQGELLYMFAYADEIAQRNCPDKRDEVMFCVKKASNNEVDFARLDVARVQQRYCQAKQQCQVRKDECEREYGRREADTCDCVNQLKQAVGSRCGSEALPPSPCSVQQSDPPKKDESGDVCSSQVPTAEEIVELVRQRNGGGKDKLAAAQTQKQRQG